jgi:SAM-dependent methyltransferase
MTDAAFDIENVFSVEDYLYFYSESLTDERSDAEVAAILRLMEIDSPLRILDLACGFGRHANRLAALGHSVTGVDYMPGFLDLARAQAAKRGVQVAYRQADMRQLDFENEFDRVILMFTAFGYFNDAENFQVLQNVARALKPGGLFGFDIPNRDVTLKTLTPAFVEEKEGNLMINRSTFDMRSGRWINQRIVIRDGVRKDKPFSIRLYNATEIQALLESAGLQVYQMYGNWQGQPLSPDMRGLVVIARK